MVTDGNGHPVAGTKIFIFPASGDTAFIQIANTYGEFRASFLAPGS